MASSISPEKSEQDIISSLPNDVTDKIMKCLPLKVAAKTSMLSRKWRLNWLSHKYLIFDIDFWETQRKDGKYDKQEISNIISNVLLHHIGPLHKFHLYVPKDLQGKNLNLSQWLSFLSRIGVKEIILDDWYKREKMPSYIFACKELVKLSIDYYVLLPPPSNFKGFAYLQCLELNNILLNPDIFKSLIANCPRLTELMLFRCDGMDNLIIDVPSLENLTIHNVSVSLSFTIRLPCLKRISLSLEEVSDTSSEKAFDVIKIVASSSELQYLHFGRQMCKFLGAYSIRVLESLACKHLQELCLTELDLGDLHVSCLTYDMLQSCPSIKSLKLSVTASTVDHKFSYENHVDYKLGYLVKVEIEGIRGSRLELSLIEYVLSISVVLKEMLLKFADTTSEAKVSRQLLRLRRASPEAELICL